MRLHEWIDLNRHTQDAAAAMFGVTQAYVSELARGIAIPSDDLAAKIEEVTRGQVTFLELKHPKFRKQPAA